MREAALAVSALRSRSRVDAWYTPELHRLRSVVAARRLPAADGVMLMGAEFGLPGGTRYVTLSDLTLAQARATHPVFSRLSERVYAGFEARQREVYAGAVACCTASHWTAASLVADHGVAAEKVHVVGLGPNHEPAAGPARRRGAAPRFLFVGREWERKHGPLLLRAFARLRAEIPDARLDLVGGHPPVSAPGVTGHGPLALDRPDEAARVSALFARGDVLRDAVGGRAVRARLHRGGGRRACRASRRASAGPGRSSPRARGCSCRRATRRRCSPRCGRSRIPAVARRMGAAARERSRLFTWELVGGAAAARAGAARRRGRGVPVSWAVCVLNWNGREDTLRCLASLRGERVIVADNGSADGSVEAIRSAFPDVEVVENGANLGFSGGNNAAIRRALERGAEWVVLLNNDAEAEPGLLDALRAAAERHPRAGVLAGKLLFPDGRVQWAGQRVGLRTGYSGRPRGHGPPGRLRVLGRGAHASARSGALMAVSRAAIERAGLLDEDLFAYVEDVDWSLRIREAGFECVFVPAARAVHRVSASTGGAALDARRCTTALATRWWCVSGTRRSGRRARRCGARASSARILAHAVLVLRSRAAVRAVLEGYRDALAGRLGPRGGERRLGRGEVRPRE